MRFETENGPLDFTPRRLIVAGWTGRDAAAVRHHIEELAAIGVPRPSAIPLYYRVSAPLLIQTKRLEALGPDTSGEAEPMLIHANGAIWLGLASDHTDRGLEARSVAEAKQICLKPCAALLWRFDDMAAPDDLSLRAWIDEGQGWTPYQEGTLAEIRPLAELIAGAGFGPGDAMLCGTLPAIGGVRPATRFRMSLSNPTTGDEIEHEYEIAVLPAVA